MEIEIAGERFKEWGCHLTLDCSGCVGHDSYDNILAFVKELVPAIDMVAYGEPQIVHFATHDPTKGGYTLVQLIETSAITGHFVDATGEAYIDIFSCKQFECQAIFRLVEQYFNPESVIDNYITRGVWEKIT